MAASAMAAAAAEAAHAEMNAPHEASPPPTPKAKPPKSRPPLPLKTRISVALLSHLTDSARRSDGSVNRRLLRVLDFTSPPNPSPVRGVSSSDVTVDPSRNLWFRIFNPSSAPGSGPLPVIVFFHGGGFSFLSAASRSYDAICRRFARKLPAVIVSVNYRLSPEHRCPAPYDDGFDVLRYMDDHPTELPREADLGRCFLAGDSAGGNIAHHVAIRACGGRLEGVKIRGMVSIQPFFGGEERTEAELELKGAAIVSMERTDLCWKGFLPEGEGDNRDHWAINVCGKNAVDITGLEDFPATVVITAGYDPLRDWQKRYYEWLKRSGKEVETVHYPNTIHAFYIFPELPESGELITVVKNFVERLT